MTEEEMKQKWCPHMRAVPNSTGYGAGNRFDGPQPDFFKCLCLGSGCAMWEPWDELDIKWVRDTEDAPEGYDLAPGYENVPRQKYTKWTKTGRGDCGLKTKELECNNC